MSTRICRIIDASVALALVLAQPASAQPAAGHAFTQLNGVSSRARQHAADVVARIRRADYEGNRDGLRALLEELRPISGDPSFASRVHYWRGFASWRRALNGFNQSPHPPDLAADLERAVAEFDRALALDASFVEAAIGKLSCLQSLAFVHRADAASVDSLVRQFVPLTRELLAKADDNPRLLWVHGASLWYVRPGQSAEETATRRASAMSGYERGLQVIRGTRTPSDSLQPAWGEPELLMSLAWSHLNAATPDLEAAEAHAREALALVPHWQYVRDILLPRIRQTRAHRRLDVFDGRWAVRGRTYPGAYGTAAGETTGSATYRRTARDNWLLSEVTLDGVPPSGVTLLIAPQPGASYVAVAVNNLVPAALLYAGRWLDDRSLEFEMSTTSTRGQRVRYTIISATELDLSVTESRDGGRTYQPHSSFTLVREPKP
jgi:hypothetical protein